MTSTSTATHTTHTETVAAEMRAAGFKVRIWRNHVIVSLTARIPHKHEVEMALDAAGLPELRIARMLTESGFWVGEWAIKC